MLFFLGQVVEIHLMIAVLCQIFQRFCVEFITFFLQLRRFGHNGGKLLGGGHVSLIFPLFLFGLTLLKFARSCKEPTRTMKNSSRLEP